jgi:hypothetical protein
VDAGHLDDDEPDAAGRARGGDAMSWSVSTPSTAMTVPPGRRSVAGVTADRAVEQPGNAVGDGRSLTDDLLRAVSTHSSGTDC